MKKHADFSVMVARVRVPILPAPVYAVDVIGPDGKHATLNFGELGDALHVVASVFQGNAPEGNAPKRKAVPPPKRKPGFLDNWVVENLKNAPRTLRDLVGICPEKVEARGMATILRSLQNRGIIKRAENKKTGGVFWEVD